MIGGGQGDGTGGSASGDGEQPTGSGRIPDGHGGGGRHGGPPGAISGGHRGSEVVAAGEVAAGEVAAGEVVGAGAGVARDRAGGVDAGGAAVGDGEQLAAFGSQRDWADVGALTADAWPRRYV